MTVNSCDKIIPSQMRKIKPTRRSLSGTYAFRGETGIQFESSLERDFLIRTEFSMCVLTVVRYEGNSYDVGRRAVPQSND